MPRPLLVKIDIAAVCGKATYQRGHSYWQSGRVLEVGWDEATQTVTGRTAGSGCNRYDQTIKLSQNRRQSFAGYCSCPVEYNCKHVAAVLLAWLEQGGAAVPATETHSTTSHLLDEWCRQFRETSQGNGSRDDGQQSLLYILKPQGIGSRQRVAVHYLRSRRLNNGRWGKPIPIAAGQFISHYGYRPYWLQGEDLELVNLAALITGAAALPILTGDVGALLLRRMIASGRCFWEDEKTAPLTLDLERPVTFAWEEHPETLHLRTMLADCDGPWLAIPVDPPWYFARDLNCCGPIATPLPGAQFQALCQLPAIPATAAPALCRTLLPLLPPNVLPLPANLPVRHLEASPTPVLTLRGDRNPRGHLVHVARVTFAYGELLLPPAPVGATTEAHHHAGEEWLIRRYPEEEIVWLRQLSRFGFFPAAATGVGDSLHWDAVFALGTLVDSALAWREFLEHLPQLRDAGWRVEIDESFRLRFETAGGLHTEIDESQAGWFDIGMDLVVGGERLPLLGLLVRWLEMGGAPGQILMVSIDNDEGRWIEVPQTILQPILATLLELFDRPILDQQGRLRLAEQLAPCLVDLEQRLATDAVDLVWQSGRRLREVVGKLREFNGVAVIEPPAGLRAELRPYQRQGLAWLQFLREYGFGGILADDMGLGKTVQALAHLLVEKDAGRLDWPALVVAPTSVLGNWRREAERFAPELRTLVLHGGTRRAHFPTVTDYDLVITSYPLLWRDEAELRKIDFHSVILDEAQAIKNPRAKWSQIACQLKSRHRLCLTGTPLENHLGELWSLGHFLMPGFLGDEPRFNRIFRQPIEKHGDEAARDALSRRLAPFLLRRLKEEVASELPPKSEIVQTVELGEAQRRLYETIRAAMADKVGALLRDKGLTRSRIEVLDALLKLRQACCDPRLVKLPSATRVKQSAKLELLMEMLEELIDEGRRVLLFSQFTSMLTLIEEELRCRLIRFTKLTGQTRRREEAIASFQNGEVPLFLISLKAGGVGLNLTAADTVIHYDPWWNPAVEQQATDRAHRIGQDKPVFVYKLVAAGTVEEKILQLQERKRQLAGSIYRRKTKDEADLVFLSAEELLGLFAG